MRGARAPCGYRPVRVTAGASPSAPARPRGDRSDRLGRHHHHHRHYGARYVRSARAAIRHGRGARAAIRHGRGARAAIRQSHGPCRGRFGRHLAARTLRGLLSVVGHCVARALRQRERPRCAHGAYRRALSCHARHRLACRYAARRFAPCRRGDLRCADRGSRYRVSKPARPDPGPRPWLRRRGRGAGSHVGDWHVAGSNVAFGPAAVRGRHVDVSLKLPDSGREQRRGPFGEPNDPRRKLCPATSYSPTQWPAQYHRR
jgi:hypothetical protein